MSLYVPGYQSNPFLRFLYSFFVQLPIEVWFRLITAYVPSSAGIINETGLPDATLTKWWAQAQQELATSPFPLSIGGPTHAADPSALTVAPEHVTVVAIPDETAANLQVATGQKDWPTPSGAFLFVGNNGLLGYTACHSYACTWRKPRVYAAESVLAKQDIVYELQNIILNKLGYDVENR